MKETKAYWDSLVQYTIVPDIYFTGVVFLFIATVCVI